MPPSWAYLRPLTFLSALLTWYLCSSLVRATPKTPAVTTATTVQTIPNDVQAEAAWRFDRGLAFYNERDYAAALVEFERAYALTRHVLVRFNIGLVEAKLGKSVACLASLEPLVASHSESLGQQRVQLARRLLNEHRPKVGSLEILTNVTEPVIQINNVEVQPDDGPILVGVGKHVVSVFAPNHEPRRVAVTVIGQAQQRVQVQLLPMQQALSHLAIETTTPDVQVLAGSELIGNTPFAATLSFKPGVHKLRFRRTGYREELRTVVLHPGSTGQVEVRMTATGEASAMGRLSIDAQDPNAVVWVDGEPRPDFAAGMALPVGRHQIRVQRHGYFDLEREVRVGRSPTQLSLELFPTATTLTEYEQQAHAGRTWSWVALGSGAALLGGSTAFLLWNQGEKNTAERAFDAQRAVAASSASGQCTTASCERDLNQLADALIAKRDRDVWGWAGASIGLVGVITGVSLRLFGDDPDAFRPSQERLLPGSVSMHASPDGLTVRGAF